VARRRTLLSWSSGKDSAWTLHELRRDPTIEVVGLLTTLNERHDRVAMHAVRDALLSEQARAAGLPVWRVPLPDPCSNDDYERLMSAVMERARAESIEAMAFGDLFLEDVRAYRERNLEASGVEALFPLWGRDTRTLAKEMMDGGLEAILTCVDPKQCSRELAGRAWDAELLAALPDGADPCGENGEFHTFVHAGPMFETPVAVRAGEVVERGGFVFADLLPNLSQDVAPDVSPDGA
jgi:uncharacterized protein (TIGR00290 family)